MNRMLDLRCGPDDAAGLRDEIERRNKIIRSLIYQVEKGGILVLALAHQSRQPEFWVDRLH